MLQKFIFPIAVLLFIIAACKNDPQPSNSTTTPATTAPNTAPSSAHADTVFMPLEPQEFENRVMRNRNLPLIDIRPAEAYKAGHIARSINWPYDTTSAFFGRFESLDRRAPIALYCQSGMFSKQAGMKLVSMGFRRVYLIKGGMLSWLYEGKVLTLN